jgi:hypothetical protein
MPPNHEFIGKQQRIPDARPRMNAILNASWFRLYAVDLKEPFEGRGLFRIQEEKNSTATTLVIQDDLQDVGIERAARLRENERRSLNTQFLLGP